MSFRTMIRVFALALPLSAHAAPDIEPFKGTKAYVFYQRETHTWRIGNDAVERTVHFDKERGALMTQEIKVKNRGPRLATVSASEGEFQLAPTTPDAPRPAPLRLDNDWAFGWQTVATPKHGGRLLTIHLEGVGRNAGYEVEALYEVLPGNRPYLAKSLTLINRTGEARTLQEVVYDRWVLVAPTVKKTGKKDVGSAPDPPKPASFARGEDGVGILSDPSTESGLLVELPSPQADIAYDRGTVIQRFKGAIESHGRGGRAYTPFGMAAVFTGSPTTGKTLIERYSKK